MLDNNICLEHSGCKEAIGQLQKDRDSDRQEIFPRIKSLEKTVWRAVASRSTLTAIAIAIIQHYWK